MPRRRFFMTPTVFATLIGVLALVVIACSSESEGSTIATTPLPTVTNTGEVPPTPSPTASPVSEVDQIASWMLNEIEQLVSLHDVIKGVGDEITVRLLAGEVTRDEVSADVERRRFDLSLILLRIVTTPPPNSETFGTDLEEFHTSLISAVKAHIDFLELLSVSVDTFPPSGGVPSDIDEAINCLEAANTKGEEALRLSRQVTDKVDEMLLKLSD